MDIVCSPQGIVDIDRPGQGMGDIGRSGFLNVVLDFSIGCRLDIQAAEQPERLYDRMKGIIDKAADQNIHFSIGLAPYMQKNTKYLEQYDTVSRLTEESIRICGQLGIKQLIIRPLEGDVFGTDTWEANRRHYLQFAELAKEADVMILLENSCKDINGHLVRGVCADEKEALHWIEALNETVGEERYGFCMNVGNCNLCGQNMYDYAVTLDTRIKAVILKECDGNQDSSMLPFTCVNSGHTQTDWLNLIRGLRKINFDGALIMEFANTAWSFSPILKPHLMQLAKATADYFRWQIKLEALLKKYDSRVLFGAGNMCRNYMKNYGKNYPPMFTCDNNPSIWGTEFEGLEVKNPENLKELPKDTAIFICNIYYREIEEQIRNMGLENPIEYFNDEYMPTFYFDRLEGNGRK